MIPNLGGKNEEDPAVPVTTGQAVRAAAAAAAREVEVEVEIPKPVSHIIHHNLFYYFFICSFIYWFIWSAKRDQNIFIWYTNNVYNEQYVILWV